MSAPNPLIADIESRIDIVDLVGEYVSLKKSGANWKWLSPFKTERTPSFMVSPAKQIAYCFATNQGGGPLKILMLLEKIEFREALQILAKRAGVELKTDTVQDALADERSILIKLYQEVQWYYAKSLWSAEGLAARTYILQRGLSQETLKTWWIGYSNDPREMFDHLKKKGFSEKILLESGIFVSAFRDRFFGRLIFPISNYRGDVIAFSGRTLKTQADEAKYVNSPETPIFHKSNVLFGIDRAKQFITKAKKVIIVEWQMDTISLHQAGIENTVGISGTALTEEHIRLIRRLTDQIYLCLDRDSAGRLAIFRSIENLRNEAVDIYVVNLGDAKDPDEFLKSGGDFQQAIQEAIPAIAFVIEEGSLKHDISTNQGKNALLQEVLAMIVQMQGTVMIDQSLRLLAQKLDLGLQSVYFEYNRAIRGKPSRQPNTDTVTPLSKEDYLIPYILGLPEGKKIFTETSVFYDEMLSDTSFGSLRQLLQDSLETDIRRVHELRYESFTDDKTPEVILQDFIQIVHQTDQYMFRRLQKAYAHDLQKLQELIIRAREHHLDI